MIGLFVFLALAIPVAIHILSRSQGKVVPFPFLNLLPTLKSTTELHIKIHQKRLLLVRLTLVLCACLLVSQLLLSDWWSKSEWRQFFTSQASSSSVVVTQSWWQLSSEQDKLSLKEQLKNGELKHVDEIIVVTHNHAGGISLKLDTKSNILNNHFSNTMLASSTSNNTNVVAKQSNNNISLGNLWSTAHSIAQNIPADSVLHIYTSNRVSQFWGEPIQVRQPIVWHISDVTDIANNNDTSPLQLALVQLEETHASLEQMQRMAETEIALQLLVSAYPAMKLTLISNNKRNALLTLAKQYDALIVDSVEGFDDSNGFIPSNVIQLSNLPPSSDSSFVLALGKAILRDPQQNALQSNAWLTAEQIKSAESSIGRSPTPIKTSAISVANKQAHIWQKYLAMLLIILFAVERVMSERRASIGARMTIDTTSQ